MKVEAQIMASLLHYGVQFLTPVPDHEEAELVKDLARDAHGLFTEVDWGTDGLQSLLWQWFKRGREHENTSTLGLIPSGVEEALKDLAAFEIQTFFARLGTDLDALCRFLWLWFQRGRSYEGGNAA